MSNENDINDVGTTGHEWDGIEELNNPLPRWWVWLFYATIVWGVGYTIAYPAWPLISSHTEGFLGYSTRGNVAADIEAVNTQNAELTAALASADLVALAEDRSSDLYNYAVNGGRSIYAANCSQCHGSAANGIADGNGYPNLLDDDWLWGGTVDEIAYTITHGIRNEQSLDTRWSQMPAFGELLPEEEIEAVVQHVLSLSGAETDATLAATGEEIYLANCAACHGDAGLGDPTQGAPNLADAVWLYGGDIEDVTSSVVNARFGVMPAWLEEYRGTGGISQAEVNAVAIYVHQLGGGE